MPSQWLQRVPSHQPHLSTVQARDQALVVSIMGRVEHATPSTGRTTAIVMPLEGGGGSYDRGTPVLRPATTYSDTSHEETTVS